MTRKGRAVSLRTSGTGIWLEQPAHAVSLRTSNLGIWLAGLLALAGVALLAFLALMPGRRAAETRIAIPPVARVTDLTGTLGADEQNALASKLADFEHASGAQLAVLVLPSTKPETIEQYGIRLAEAWKLGRKGMDDGVILIVAKDDHKLRIEVGYGLEGNIPDAVASRIIEETMVPAFKADNFYQGINAGVDRIIHAAVGAAAAPTPQQDAAPDQAAAAPAPAADETAEAPDAAQTPQADSEEATLERYAREQRRMDREEYLILGLMVFCLVIAVALRRRLGSLGGPLAGGALFAAVCLLLSHWLEVDAVVLAVFGGSVVSVLSLAGIRGWNSRSSGSFSSRSDSMFGSGSGDSFGGGGGGFGGGGASGGW